MSIKIFQIDSFTSKLFCGNPAAVCVLEEYPDHNILKNIARENNLSETAFIVKKEDNYLIRWFTPECEVDLCGHATLAAGYVVLYELEKGRKKVVFNSPYAGDLIVDAKDRLLIMDFPVRPSEKCEPPEDLETILGKPFVEVYKNIDLMVVFEKAEDVKNLKPDINKIKELQAQGVIVTAPSIMTVRGLDFVSRYFAPRVGIAEDPVTGSAHCTLVPYWANRLNKKQLLARQVSEREGQILCEYKDDRVILAGEAVCYLKGEIFI